MVSITATSAILKSASIFAETPDDILAQVAALLKPVQLKAGKAIFHKGEHGDCLYIITHGQVRVHDGELTLNYLGATEVFGEMALLDSEPRVATVTATQDTHLLRLDQAPFYKLMAEQPEVSKGVIRVLCSHLRSRVTDMTKDFDYIQQMTLITNAAAALEAGNYDPSGIAEVVQRTDELGQLARVFIKMAREVSARDRRLELLRVVIPVGVALSAERDFNRLLETIVIEAQKLCNADAGTLYLLTEENLLQFVIVRNNSLGITMGGTSGHTITFPPLKLYDDATGEPNHHNVATHVTLSHQRINIPDAYQVEGFDFSGTKAFDKNTGYRSKSFLTIPLEDTSKKVIGVIQLINAQHSDTGEIIPFAPDDVIESLVLLASAALAGYIREESLRKQIEELRIQIDEAKKARQVAEITESDYFQALQQKVKELRKH